MNIRLYNARILSMRGQEAICYGEVWIRDSKILYAGPEQGRKPEEIILWDREIDLHGNLVLPGFKNAHTHSPMSALRSLADDMSLDAWLHEKVFPFESHLTEEDMRWFTKLSILEYLNSGITQIFDMYFALDAVADVCRQYCFPLVMCGAVNDFVQSVSTMEELYHRMNVPGDDLIRYKLGFHAQYTTGDRLLHEIAELARALREPVCMHIAETAAEVEQCRKQYGCSPFAYLNEMGMFEYGGTGFHCVHLSADDIAIMREHGMVAVTNPSSNLKLASGIADVTELMRNGIRVGIGTDGPASNNCLSMFKEMFLTATLGKVVRMDAAALPAGEVVRMATLGGCDAMGSEQNRYCEAGQYADLAVIDLDRPNMHPIHDSNSILSNLVYSAGRDNVMMTIVRGNILYEKGQYYLADSVEEIYDRCNGIARRIAGTGIKKKRI